MKKPDYIEKSNQGLVAILFILFFLVVASTCRSQSRDYPNPMRFSCGKLDTIYVNIESDSTYSSYHLTVSCTKHKHLEWKSITLGFENDEILEVFQADGWAISNVELLKTVPFDFISFDEQFFSTACISIRTKDYFIKHLSK